MFQSAIRTVAPVIRRWRGAPKQIRVVEESIDRYCQGGFHPVRIGDVFANRRYEVVQKLGYGLYSTVWLAFDSKTTGHVALKLLTADCYGHGKEIFEREILSDIKLKSDQGQGSQHVLGLLDNFEHVGPNGTHVCLVLKAMGPDMSRLRMAFKGCRLPVPLLKRISRQLLHALAFLHDTCQVIHTDIKPKNILVETPNTNMMFEYASSGAFRLQCSSLAPPHEFYTESSRISLPEEDLSRVTDISVRLADFGTASWFTRHLTEFIQPDKLRAPEVILEAKWDHKVDIWNLGLVIWELSQGRVMFDGLWNLSESYKPAAHLAQMKAILGEMPQSLLSRSRCRDQFFDADDQLLDSRMFKNMPLETICGNHGMSEQDKGQFLSMIKSMIQLEPSDRPDARSLLESAWLK